MKRKIWTGMSLVYGLGQVVVLGAVGSQAQATDSVQVVTENALSAINQRVDAAFPVVDVTSPEVVIDTMGTVSLSALALAANRKLGQGRYLAALAKKQGFNISLNEANVASVNTAESVNQFVSIGEASEIQFNVKLNRLLQNFSKNPRASMELLETLVIERLQSLNAMASAITESQTILSELHQSAGEGIGQILNQSVPSTPSVKVTESSLAALRESGKILSQAYTANEELLSFITADSIKLGIVLTEIKRLDTDLRFVIPQTLQTYIADERYQGIIKNQEKLAQLVEMDSAVKAKVLRTESELAAITKKVAFWESKIGKTVRVLAAVPAGIMIVNNAGEIYLLKMGRRPGVFPLMNAVTSKAVQPEEQFQGLADWMVKKAKELGTTVGHWQY